MTSKRYRKKGAMLTPSDAARIMNVHINTLRRWTNNGILRSYRIDPRRDRRIRLEDIAVFPVKSKGEEATSRSLIKPVRPTLQVNKRQDTR